MAMIVPHQSQVGIATGNGGQAAPYRSASAFMTPGQSNMPEGLNQLARGMDKLGNALANYGIDSMKMQNATDLLADKIAYEDALRDFDSNYRQTHQGASARDAEQAYAQFHKEQYDKLQQKWGGNSFLMLGVNQMAESIRQPSMQHAVTYRDQQEDLYQKDVLASSESRALELCGDPSRSAEEKENALREHENTLRMFAGQKPVMVDGKIEWQGGRNIDAHLTALRQKASVLNIEGKLANKDVNGAQRALDRTRGGAGGYSGMGSLAVGHESGGDPGNVSPDTSGSFSYGLFQFNSKKGGTAHTFMSFLKQNHPEIYKALGSGYLAVGSKEFNQVFREVANGDLKDEMVKAQQEHFAANYKAPIEDKLRGSAVYSALGNNEAFQEVMLSTAIQHGPGGANRILREAWGMVDKNADPQAQLEQFITATYQLRGRPGEFKTALSEQKDEAARNKFMSGLQARYRKEEAQALDLARGNRPSRLTPSQDMALQGKIDRARREQVHEAGLTAQSFSNHLDYGLDKGDFTAAEKDVAALRANGFQKEADELSGRLEIARTAYGALNDVSDLPLVEQRAAAHAQLDKLVTPDNAKASTAMRDSVDKSLAAKQEAFVKDPAAYVANLPTMQDELSTQERIQRSLELQNRMGKGLQYEPRVLTSEQAKQLKNDYDKLDSPATRAAWLGRVSSEYGPYARQALHEMKVPEQVVTLLPVLGVMNEKSMGLALSAIEVKDSDIAGLDKDTKQAAVDAVTGSRLMQDVLSLTRTFPANEAMRQFGKSMETMLTNYVKLGGNIEDFEKAFESSTSGDCFLMLPRNPRYSVDDVVDATKTVREEMREKLLADIPANTQQGRIDRANLTALIDRGIFISDETGTKVSLVDPQHGRPVRFADGTPMTFDIATLVKEGAEKGAQRRFFKDASAGFGMTGEGD